MTDAASSDAAAEAIARAVAKALSKETPISHGTARAVAIRFQPQGRSPQGRAVYRKALQEFIASGVMKSINTTPPRWKPHPNGELNAEQALWEAICGEGRMAKVSESDKAAIFAFGDYLHARRQAGDLDAVPGWSDLPIE